MNRLQGIGLFVVLAGGALLLALLALQSPSTKSTQTETSAPVPPSETAPPPPVESAAPPVASDRPPTPLDASLATIALGVDAANPEAAPPNQFDVKAAITQHACTNARNMERARNWEHSPPIKKIFEEEKARCLAGGGHW
jgi:type IV secretory pathway VirB10-like protein